MVAIVLCLCTLCTYVGGKWVRKSQTGGVDFVCFV